MNRYSKEEIIEISAGIGCFLNFGDSVVLYIIFICNYMDSNLCSNISSSVVPTKYGIWR